MNTSDMLGGGGGMYEDKWGLPNTDTGHIHIRFALLCQWSPHWALGGSMFIAESTINRSRFNFTNAGRFQC